MKKFKQLTVYGIYWTRDKREKVKIVRTDGYMWFYDEKNRSWLFNGSGDYAAIDLVWRDLDAEAIEPKVVKVPKAIKKKGSKGDLTSSK